MACLFVPACVWEPEQGTGRYTRTPLLLPSKELTPSLSYRAVRCCATLRSAMSQEDKLRIKLNPKFHKDAAAMQELSKETGFSVDNVSAGSCLPPRLALPRGVLKRRRVGSISIPECCRLVMCLSPVGWRLQSWSSC